MLTLSVLTALSVTDDNIQLYVIANRHAPVAQSLNNISESFRDSCFEIDPLL